jgi:anaerobic magnesium-protoporphyrin IX monomethyl ester cyclase
MRILLVRPNSIIIATPVPLGLGYVASYLLKQRPNDQVKIIDARNQRLSHEQVAEQAKIFAPDLIGISAINFEADQVHKLTGLLKSALGDLPIVLGGPYASANRESILERDPSLDYVAVCEGEQTFFELTGKLEQKQIPSDVPGLFYRENGAIKFTGERTPIDDLDQLDFDWELLAPLSYFSKRGRNSENIVKYSHKTLTMLTSRGCPFGCIFCHNIFGRKFRKRSAEKVVDEIELLIKKYRVEELELVDDSFNMDLKRAKQICRLIIERRLKVHIALPNGIRGDIVDEEFLDLLKQAGFYRIAFAVESASPRIQEIMKKKIDLQKVKWSIAEVSKRGMIATGYFIMGFPTETEQDIKMTIDFAKSSRLNVASFFYLNPFPGTEVARMAGEEKVLDKLFRDYSTMTVNLSAVSDETLHRLNKSAYRSFYLSPGRILRTLRVVPKNFRTFVNMFLVVNLLFRDSVNQ